jgi:hypothetical protein
MTIYIPLLYICLALECGFFQSSTYTLSEQKCSDEIEKQKIELIKQGRTVQAICVDANIQFKKQNIESDRKPDLNNTIYQTLNKN